MEIMGNLSVVRYTVGTIKEYRKFIKALREKLAKRKKDGSKEEIKVNELSAPVLPNLGDLQDEQGRWLHIELRAKKQYSNGNWTTTLGWTTTLAMRKDNCYIVGFTGKDGKWFELDESRFKLPKEYNSTLLHWNIRYKSIMNLKNQDQVRRTLGKTRLGMAFAIRAVHRLSQYPDHDYKDENPTGLGLAGLIVLICESARMETIRKEFQKNQNQSNQNQSNQNQWDKKGVVIEKNVLDYIWKWAALSGALMRWNKYGYKEYSGSSHVGDALDLRLVYNSENVDGGAKVEILAVSANFDVTSITVTDANGKHHKIYNNEVRRMEQGKKLRVITPTKNKLFVTWNKVQQDYGQTIIQKALKQFGSLGISNITTGPLSDQKICNFIVHFRNEDLAERARQRMSDELDKEQVIIRWEDPRIKAKEMVDLELNVLPPDDKGISGYKWFDMDIKPRGVAGTEAMEWRLDCRKQGGDDASEVVTRNITFDSQRKMDFTYLVMSDPVKAKVEVRLRRRSDPYAREDGDSKCTVHGEIVARIDSFDHRIVLFRINDKFEAKALERWLTFPLERYDVWVPRGSKRIHIEMKDLHVTAGDREVVSIPSLSFGFELGDWRPSSGDKDSEVEVNIAWDGIPQKESIKPDVKWTVGDDAQAFIDHIEQLRDKVAMRKHGHVLEGYSGTGLKERPVLAKPEGVKAEQYVHIKLQAKADDEILSTTLAVRDDNCSGVGFMNQSEVWYDLGHLWGWGERDKILPAKYNSVLLGWGVRYNQILEPSDLNLKQILMELNNKGQRKDFVMKAVGTLSRYPDVEDDSMDPRIAVVALMIVSCESAKLDVVHKSFEDWGTKVEFTQEMMAPATTSINMKRHILAWEEMSRALLHWKDHFYRKWPQGSNLLKRIKITSQSRALEAVHLVLNRRCLPDQIDMTYTIDGDEKGYNRFIDELRRMVTNHQHSETLARVLPRPGDGPMWWNIQLKVAGEEETSTTLALRGDDLRIYGFRSGREDNCSWYQIYGCERTVYERSMFEKEYNAMSISVDSGFTPAARYGNTIARAAVRELSGYTYPIGTLYHWTGGDDDANHLWWPLENLQLMVSDAASIITVHDAVRQVWPTESWMWDEDRKLRDLSLFWHRISISALEQWEWERSSKGIGLRSPGKSPQDATEVVFALIKAAGDLGSK